MTKRQIFNGWQKITNTQKTEDWDAQTTKNPAVRTALIPLQGRQSWGKLPSLLLKIEGGGNSFAPLFGIKFKKKKLFYFSTEAYIVHLAKGMIWNHSEKIVKIVKKNNGFFLNVKCFLKNVWGYPCWKPNNFFLLKICPVFSHYEWYDAFSVLFLNI